VKIKDSALVAAANLSHRSIADRFLPDKAIDLVDEAASRLAMELESVPTEIDECSAADQLELADRQLAETEERQRRKGAGNDRARKLAGCAAVELERRLRRRAADSPAWHRARINQLAGDKEKQSAGNLCGRTIDSTS
jgi:ATP-dependent Clp protease ATP-binding subunit ClpA